MNERGDRVRDFNLCVHSEAVPETACGNAVKYARLLRPTTGRYFCWIDDGQPMCRCPKCRELSDSEQTLVLENRVLAALREDDPQATLAHLAYAERGIRHITSFGAWIDGDYVRRFGEPPIAEYARAMAETRP